MPNPTTQELSKTFWLEPEVKPHPLYPDECGLHWVGNKLPHYSINARPRTGLPLHPLKQTLCVIEDNDLFQVEDSNDAIQVKPLPLYSDAKLRNGDFTYPGRAPFHRVVLRRNRIWMHTRAPGDPSHKDNLQVLQYSEHAILTSFLLEDNFFDNTGQKPADTLFQEGLFGPIEIVRHRFSNTNQGLKFGQKNPNYSFPLIVLRQCEDLQVTFSGHPALCQKLVLVDCKNVQLPRRQDYSYDLETLDTQQQLQELKQDLARKTEALQDVKQQLGGLVEALRNF